MSSIMKDVELEICFKGDRDYLYASDIFNAVVEKISTEFDIKEMKAVDFSVHHMSHSKLSLDILYEEPTDLSEIQSLFRFHYKNKDYFCLIKKLSQSVNCREDYNEESIINQCNIELLTKSITLMGSVNYSMLDCFTAMNKYLLKSLFPDIKEKWISVRIKMSVIKDSFNHSLQVKFERKFSDKYTKSALFADGEEIGNLFFSII